MAIMITKICEKSDTKVTNCRKTFSKVNFCVIMTKTKGNDKKN